MKLTNFKFPSGSTELAFLRFLFLKHTIKVLIYSTQAYWSHNSILAIFLNIHFHLMKSSNNSNKLSINLRSLMWHLHNSNNILTNSILGLKSVYLCFTIWKIKLKKRKLIFSMQRSSCKNCNTAVIKFWLLSTLWSES